MSNKKETAEQRKIRLAKALKANIGRRKAQARQRDAAETESGAASGTEQEQPLEEDGCRN
jgi:hypothetical protein